ncbi:MAG TPA: O-antigen ligase family protein, partial [Pyrinomonadaceae bacterium]|nr:O-antigen ligase family protein [Pyrinomonadaceae bacterium]
IPLPELSPHAMSLPPDRLRLAGLHANPLASAKFILVIACMLAACLIVPDQGRSRLRTVTTWSLLAIFALALAATESKSSILAFLISLLVITFAAYRVETITFRKLLQISMVGFVFVATVLVWTLVLAAPVKRYAATAWLDSDYNTASRLDLNELAGPKPPPSTNLSAPPRSTDLVERFKSELRIGQSFRLQAKTGDLDNPLKSQLSQETATQRDCGLMCTGQRDLLWKAGLEVIKEHWLAGIGFGAWKRVLDQKLGFPFDHPHNGFMEVWGEFGIVGAAMYLSLIVFLVRRARSAIRTQAIGFEKWFLVGSSMAGLAFLANELFDTTKFFSMSPHAIWIWSLLALQERYLRQPLTWSAPSRFISFLSGKIKYQPAAAPFAGSNP